VDDIGAMYRFEATEYLVNKVLENINNQITSDFRWVAGTHLTVIISKLLRTYDAVKIGLHKFLNDFLGFSATDVDELNALTVHFLEFFE
jgi:hypothetical protein